MSEGKAGGGGGKGEVCMVVLTEQYTVFVTSESVISNFVSSRVG